jgi:hypothetical protein
MWWPLPSLLLVSIAAKGSASSFDARISSAVKQLDGQNHLPKQVDDHNLPPADVCFQSRFNWEELKQVPTKVSDNDHVNHDSSSPGPTRQPLLSWSDSSMGSHLVASCLTLGLIGLAVHEFLFQRATDHAIYWVLGLLYLGEAGRCSTRRYLSNMRSPQDVHEMIQSLVDTPPMVQWKLECYHYRTSSSSHQSRKVTTKVTTHTATRDFCYQQ